MKELQEIKKFEKLIETLNYFLKKFISKMPEVLEKEVKSFSTYGSHVYLPKRYRGKRVKIIILR